MTLVLKEYFAGNLVHVLINICVKTFNEASNVVDKPSKVINIP